MSLETVVVDKTDNGMLGRIIPDHHTRCIYKPLSSMAVGYAAWNLTPTIIAKCVTPIKELHITSFLTAVVAIFARMNSMITSQGSGVFLPLVHTSTASITHTTTSRQKERMTLPLLRMKKILLLMKLPSSHPIQLMYRIGRNLSPGDQMLEYLD